MFAATAPRSGVEKTPAGSGEVGVVLNVVVATQKDESEAAVSPLVPLSVASVVVMTVAAPVVGVVAANAVAPSERPNVLNTRVNNVTVERDFLIFSKVPFCIPIMFEK